jgi:hypothetical protein
MWFHELLDNQDSPILSAETPRIPSAAIEAVLKDVLFDISSLSSHSKPEFEASEGIPIISFSFQCHLFRDENVPTPEEHWGDYERDNYDFLRPLSPSDLLAVQYRAMRAYPSLIRDVHFVSIAREMGLNVSRTLSMDIAGIDAVVSQGDLERKIRLYYDSKRSRRARRAKAISHEIEPGTVDFGLTKENSRQIGDIFLYAPDATLSFLSDLGFSIPQEGISAPSTETSSI